MAFFSENQVNLLAKKVHVLDLRNSSIRGLIRFFPKNQVNLLAKKAHVLDLSFQFFSLLIVTIQFHDKFEL